MLSSSEGCSSDSTVKPAPALPLYSALSRWSDLSDWQLSKEGTGHAEPAQSFSLLRALDSRLPTFSIAPGCRLSPKTSALTHAVTGWVRLTNLGFIYQAHWPLQLSLHQFFILSNSLIFHIFYSSSYSSICFESDKEEEGYIPTRETNTSVKILVRERIWSEMFKGNDTKCPFDCMFLSQST